jgi:hypothetical protein
MGGTEGKVRDHPQVNDTLGTVVCFLGILFAKYLV